MPGLIKAKEPFEFYTRSHLAELTGLRACTLTQLLSLIKEVPGSCIYHHTHRFLQQHQYLSPEPPNDFAFWVTDILGDAKLGEKLSSIDTIQYSTIRSLRERIVKTIEDYLQENPISKMRVATEGEEFHFIKSISFVFATGCIANDLKEFVEILERITIDSIYFHIFEARLRVGRGDNDFSNWIEHATGDTVLAHEISKLDPYTHTLEDLRKVVVETIKKKFRG